MSKDLVIVFVKNIKLGKVKTRLAETIGDRAAIEVYSELVDVTRKAIENVNADIRIYFSESLENGDWQEYYKAVQKGEDLGERMRNAFEDGLIDGYESIVLIGSDLPEIDQEHITAGLNALNNKEIVFGPAIDGGYYLVGLSSLHDELFKNKPWSQSSLLEVTLKELDDKKISYELLKPLNDIDTYEDLVASNFYKSNKSLIKRIDQLNDKIH
ncbi:MAG: TIGR04282 family arsenosugar biosynthesis glycosyltransferase [Bacteroidia bacterium]|nr:TIGR04282 family arsenosugar biosynthesis glycosyltransferase [Bacteroidia bacterium]NNK28883.1 glycosyltransferase [Flavobacteriaceae bacterium]